MIDSRKISVCVYDNPATMSRECWESGVLRCSYSAAFLHTEGTQNVKIFFGANVGEWQPGRIVGDAAAIGAGVSDR